MLEQHGLRMFWALVASLLLHLLVIGDVNRRQWWQPFVPDNPVVSLDVLLIPDAAPVKPRINPVGDKLKQQSRPQPAASDDPGPEMLAPPPNPGKFIAAETPDPVPEPLPVANPPAASDAMPTQANEDKLVQHLPPNGKLIYRFYWGTARWLAGEAIHQWQITNGYYSLTSTVRTTGIFQWLHPVKLEEVSKGKINGAILQPLQFSTQLNEYPPAVAIFDWDKELYRWFRGKAVFNQALPKNSYDKISYLYQLYLAPRNENYFSAEITTGRRLEHYDIVNLGLEEIDIDGEAHQSIHLQRATSSPDMEKIDIWLAANLNHLPLKMTYANQAGDHFEQLI
ncbi:MAG: DUF3108 domain-containing protein, partial [Sterolibacterium sp.]